MARVAFCTGNLISMVYMGIDPLASGNMTKVGKSDCEGTFAAMRRDGEDAPGAGPPRCRASSIIIGARLMTRVSGRGRCGCRDHLWGAWGLSAATDRIAQRRVGR